MPRRPKPDPSPYLRLILCIPAAKKILSTDEQARLDLSCDIIEFVAKQMPRKRFMSKFIHDYMLKHNLSRSYIYKIKAKLEALTIIKFDDYWQEYQINMERYKRDLKALNQFKAQVDEWQGGS